MSKGRKKKFTLAAAWLVFIFLVGGYSLISAQSNSVVNVIEIDGIINPVTTEFIIDNIVQAEKDRAQALVIELDTPGGLDTSMRDIVKRIMSSDVPVIVYVYPSGARAASAGVWITLSSHVAAMAPGTNIGSAHPVSMGQEMDEVMSQKVENDAAAHIRSIADQRGRNSEWAEKAVRESVSIASEEARELNVIDYLSPSLSQLLAEIDGKTVKLDSREVTLNTKDAAINRIEMGWRYKVLYGLSDPNVAYILMMIGFAGLYFELSNPGAIFPGVAGAISLILAFYSFQSLPVNYAGVLLIILSVILFIAEIKVVSHGVLAIGGVISLFLGSMMLIKTTGEGGADFLRISFSVIFPTVIMISAFFIFAITLAVRAQMKKVDTGSEGIIGEIGEAKTDLAPPGKGKVFIHGEFWDAESSEPVLKGEKVKVIGVKDLTIKVKKVTE